MNMCDCGFRGILDGMSNVMAARSMKWELDAVYPGLQMRVGAYHGMNSVLEFVIDPEQDVDSGRKAFYASDSPSVGKSKKAKKLKSIRRINSLSRPSLIFLSFSIDLSLVLSFVTFPTALQVALI